MLPSIISYFVFGATLGLSSGFIPGPFQATVISQTLKHGFKEAFKVICSVFITDIILIPLTLLVLSRFTGLDFYMGIISLLGAGYLLKLAYENFKLKETEVRLKDAKPQSLRKGMLVILLSPGSYIFWLTLGGPTIISAYSESILAVFAFMAGAYGLFIAANALIAALVSRSADFLKSTAYKYIIKFLGLVLLVFAAVFLQRGLRLLGVL